MYLMYFESPKARTATRMDGTLISVRLWNFKDGGSQKARFLAKNQYTQRKPLYFENTGAPVCQKLRMILENKVVQKNLVDF